MPTIKIYEVVEKAKSNGGMLKKIVVQQEGKQYTTKNVTVFDSHPDYAKIVPGYTIYEGSYIDKKVTDKPNPHGGFYNEYTLRSGSAQNSPQTSQNAPGATVNPKTEAKLDAIWKAVQAIGKHLNIPSFMPPVDARDALHANIKEDSSNMANFDDIKPEDIPF